MNYLTTEDGKPINDNNPLAVKDSGTAGTGITPPTGATGTLGWLSGIYNLLFGGTAKVSLSGSNMELYGVGTANRPAADAVPAGAIYCDVTNQLFWQSDGTNWVVI